MLNLVLKDNYLSSGDNREKLAKEFKVEITPELESFDTLADAFSAKVKWSLIT